MTTSASAPPPKPRVAHISSAHQRNDIRIFIKECSSLARAGYDVHLYVGDDRGAATVNGVNVHDVGAGGPGRFRRMIIKPWRIWAALRRSKEKVVHFHDPELIPITLLLHWAGTSVIYDAHEDVPRQILSKPWLPAGMRRLIAGAFEAVENFAARRYTAVVTATPHIAARFARIGARTLDINNYPLPNELVAVATAEHKAPPQPTRNVCYIGGISAIRGVREIIAALPAADATLLLAGPFEDAVLEAELRAMPGWKHVEYKGVVSREGVRDILAEAAVGLVLFHPMPNHVHALPNKMFEYMSASVPVMASNFPMWVDIIERSGAGRCANPESPSDIARVLREMLDDRETLQRQAEAGRHAVETEFNWISEERKLLALYAEVSRHDPSNATAATSKT